MNVLFGASMLIVPILAIWIDSLWLKVPGTIAVWALFELVARASNALKMANDTTRQVLDELKAAAQRHRDSEAARWN